MKTPWHHVSFVAVVVGALAGSAATQNESSPAKPVAEPTVDAGFPEFRQRAIDWLLERQKDGAFFIESPRGNHTDTGLTGLAIAALQTKPANLRSVEEQHVIDAGLEYLVAQQNDDGSIGKRVVNYTTCAAVAAIARAGRDKFKPVLGAAQRYILGIQHAEQNGHAKTDRDYGSVGYGGDERGDLSNLQFAVTALRQSGLEANHEAFARAIVFLQRTQNLRDVNNFETTATLDGETEARPVTSGDDGGAAYYPGHSSMGFTKLADGKLVPRSYGSMTYSLLKTYTLCGVGEDDPRVRAAIGWVQDNWTLDMNPGARPDAPRKTQHEGLFYYYMVLAQALETMGLDALETPEGEVNWRRELEAKLRAEQREDGSWVNAASDRWWEGYGVLCTVYALLALDDSAPVTSNAAAKRGDDR